MSPTAFTLAPYPGSPFPADVRLTGEARREGAILHLSWRLEAPSGTVALPRPGAHPERRRELWEATCFEFFLASPEAPGYWEFNLSPSGDWNVFRFDGYRAGMRDEQAFNALPASISSRPGVCEAAVRLDLSVLGLAEAPWHLAVSAVVAEPGGRVTYWALSHPGAEPDFHHPDARTLAL